MKNLNLQSLIIIAVLALVTILWGIGSVPLFDPDEPVYAETAREMIKYNDYLSPRIFDNFWYDKPPMYYWLVAASIGLFGDGEAAARFPAALMRRGSGSAFPGGVNGRCNFCNALFFSKQYFFGTCRILGLHCFNYLRRVFLSWQGRSYRYNFIVFYDSRAFMLPAQMVLGNVYCHGSGHCNQRSDWHSFSRCNYFPASAFYREFT